MWNELHNSRHPRGLELQRRLQRGHVLSDRELSSLHAQPTASWWTQRDNKAGAQALSLIKQGHVLNQGELKALRYSSARLPPIVPTQSPVRSSALVHQPSPAQVALGYQQRISLENNSVRRLENSMALLGHTQEEAHALSAPSLLGVTAGERLAARTDRINDLKQQIRAERRERRRLQRSVSEPTMAGSSDPAASAPNAWFEERDSEGRTIFVHLDGKRAQRERPVEGEVFNMLSYLADSPFKGQRR